MSTAMASARALGRGRHQDDVGEEAAAPAVRSVATS